MNILVTGGTGVVGTHVIKELVARGHRVTNIGRTPRRAFLASMGENDHWHLAVDLNDAGQVYQALAMSKAEAVLHMGAWSNAAMVPSSRTFAENTVGTYNLFQACADMGIKRVVWGSSAQVYGFARHAPAYVPVDENHPFRPLNPYALSKIAGEEAAEYFNANDGMEILSFRIMAVRGPEQLDAEIDHLAAKPETGTFLLWSRGDARDCARACRLALEAETVEPGPYNITGSVVLEAGSASLVDTYFGPDTEVRRPLEGHEPILSCEKAERVFGWRPEFVWTERNRFPVE